jgi:hypothetical protein
MLLWEMAEENRPFENEPMELDNLRRLVQSNPLPLSEECNAAKEYRDIVREGTLKRDIKYYRTRHLF